MGPMILKFESLIAKIREHHVNQSVIKDLTETYEAINKDAYNRGRNDLKEELELDDEEE